MAFKRSAGRPNEEDRMANLEQMLRAMQADFAQCAKGTSPCFFCANDSTCNCTDDKDCKFVWEKHY